MSMQRPENERWRDLCVAENKNPTASRTLVSVKKIKIVYIDQSSHEAIKRNQRGCQLSFPLWKNTVIWIVDYNYHHVISLPSVQLYISARIKNKPLAWKREMKLVTKVWETKHKNRFTTAKMYAHKKCTRVFIETRVLNALLQCTIKTTSKSFTDAILLAILKLRLYCFNSAVGFLFWATQM